MSDRNTESQVLDRWKRRRFLQVAAGAGVLPFSEAVNAQSTKNTTGGDEIWRFETGHGVRSSPTVIDNTVYIGSEDGYVYALDVENGEEQWRFETTGRVRASPTVVDDTVFVGGVDGGFGDYRIYAIDAKDGSELWQSETMGTGNKSPTVVNQTVYVGSQNTIYALDAESGEQEWESEVGGVGEAVTVVDSTVFAGTIGGRVYAIDATNGDQQWEFSAGLQVIPAPTVVEDTVFIGGSGGLIATSRSDGTEKWRFEMGGQALSQPTVLDNTVYFVSENQMLYAMNATTGDRQWEFEMRGRVDAGIAPSSPTIVNGTVIVGSRGIKEGDSMSVGSILAVDASTGDQQWVFETGDEVESSPTVVDGVVYVGSYDGHVYALDAGVDGSSEGARISLGTLGHHDDWRYADQTIDIDPDATPSSTQGFHPGEHGFGFDNWSGIKSWSVDGQDLQYDPADVSEENVRQLVEEVWPSEHGEALIEPVVKYVYTQFNQGTLTDGHCYGMIHAAMEYFEDSSALPDAADSASDVPYPVGQYETVGDDIRYYHQSQFFDSASSSSVLQEWDDFKSWVFSILLPGFANVNLTAEIEELRDAIDEYGFAPISLADPGNDDYHQVLGYDYEVAGDETTVLTYDPNDSERYYVDESVEFYRLEVDESGSPTMDYYFNDSLEPYAQFVSMSDVQRDADLREVAVGAVITALIGAGESAKPYLEAAAQVGERHIRLMFAGLHSPAHLEVTGPDEATIIQPDRSEVNETMDYTDVAFVFGAPTGDYSYEIVGEGNGEYTLEMIGASQDEVLVSEEVEGEITEGERHNVNVMIPDTGDAEISLDKEGNSSESGLVDIETVAGGGAVTAGLLYAAYRMTSDDHSSE